jgi:hypothetical protein
VQQILKGACWIQSAHPDSAARRDLLVFRVLAWCSQLNVVPAAVNLFIPEAMAEAEILLSKWDLAYPVAISVIPGRATVDDVQPPPSQRPDRSHRCPRWRRLRSPQLHPSAAEPEPSRQGPRAPMRSRLGPAVTCAAPPTADLQEVDPSRRGSLASPVPQAHASVPEAACTHSTVRCGAAIAGDIPSAATSCPCPPP